MSPAQSFRTAGTSDPARAGIDVADSRPATSDTATTTSLAGGGFIDDIAVQRCIAGTLDHGAGMTRAERELAVVTLYRRGYTNPEIVRRTGVSIRTIGSILRRPNSKPASAARHVAAVPNGTA